MPPQSGNPEPWMQQALQEGYLRLAQGDRQGAADCCRRVLTATPNLPEGHFLVGLIAAESNDPGTAVQAFGSVTKLAPEHGAAWAQLARLFMRLGHVNRADEALARAVQYQDGNPVVQDTIATVFTLLGDTGEAAQWLQRAVSQQPRNVPFRINQANNQMFSGDFEAARNSLQSALSEQPENANAHWLLSGLERASDDRHVQQLQDLLQRAQGNPRDRAYLGYALGKELEDLEHWPQAFDAYALGAAARRQSVSYNENAESAMFTALERTFDRAWLERQAPGYDDPAPVFIIGQPRTGTTLVERIITSHSMVHSAGELRQFDSSLRRLLNYRGRERHSAELVTGAAAMDLQRLGEAYMTISRTFQGTLPRFVDKLPTNYRYLPLILAALPRAKIIHLRREPMDACFASFKQLFAEAYPHSYQQEEMARHHARYLRLMACWRERFGDRFHEVHYEEVAANLEPNARALIDFLGLPWEPACLEFHRQESAVTTASVVQVREAAHTRSVGRWRRYAQQLQPMRLALAAEGVAVD